MVNGIKEYEFQNDCVDYLIEKSVETDSNTYKVCGRIFEEYRWKDSICMALSG